MTKKEQLLLILLFPFLIASCGGDNGDEGETPDEHEPEASSERETAANPLSQFGIDTDSGVPQGLEVGDRAPGFQAITQNGDSVELKQLLEDGPLVLFFYRGQWCPICSKTLKQYADSLLMVREKGVSVLAVTPETSDNVQRTRKKTKTEVRIVPDTSENIMEDYKVLFRVTEAYTQKIEEKLGSNIAENNGDETPRLPVPATYLIGTDGKIAWRHFEHDYSKRASVKAILKALERTNL